MIVARKKGECSVAWAFEYYLTGISDEEDETAELMRELEKIKRERAEQREREASPSKMWERTPANRRTGVREGS